MEQNEIKNKILANSANYFLRDKKNKGFICPICGSGSGQNGTGITTKDGIHFTCWVGCFTNKDIFDIIGLQYGLTSFKDQFKKAAELFDLSENIPVKQKKSAPQKIDETDYTNFFLQANQHISDTNYHRGLSLETLNRFQIGFVPDWKHPKSPKMKPSPRLIIPTGKSSYLARYAGQGDFINYKGIIENKSKVGISQIFNLQALSRSQQPVFIVEGEIDALSVIDVGGEAVGLGSIGNVNRLLSLLKDIKPSQPLIISMDNDKNPQTRERVAKAVQQLSDGLKSLSIDCYTENISGNFKDSNEFLNADRQAFTFTVNSILHKIETAEAESLENEKELLRQEAVSYSIKNFRQAIEKSKSASFFPTGFEKLDKILDGGLYAGLYFVGAISSLGKTTFCLQIADHIAQSGQDVLIFSLEMARNELIAKSVSRLTFTLQDDPKLAKTTRGILTGSRYEKYNQSELDIIEKAISVYENYSHNIYITEGVGDIGIENIRDKVQKHIKLTGKSPVVLIDYLQIISPANPHSTDKQNTDRAVLELKRISRDNSVPVICISSFNRDNYSSPVNLASFKESGAIEYSSDVLIGLQYDGMDHCEGETEKNRDKRIRELVKEQLHAGKHGQAQKLQVKVLKNRNGCKGSTRINFYPMFNYFTESDNSDKEISDVWEPVFSDYSST